MKLNPPLQDSLFLHDKQSIITNPTWIRFFETVGGVTPPSGGVTSLGNLRHLGVWVADRYYYINDVVKGSDGFYYLCVVNHTSESDTEPPDGGGWANVWDKFGGITGTRKYLIERSLTVLPALVEVSSDVDVIAETPVGDTVDMPISIDLVGASVGTDVATFTNTAEVTINQASPAVVTYTGHSLVEGTVVFFRTSGTLPSPISANTRYYVRNPDTDILNISLAESGSLVNTTNAGSGTHRIWVKD